jgi:predicted RNase H-like nuclease (RuvC/YqgF family)
MTNDRNTILAEIEALLEPGDQTGLAVLEHTLTAGYAEALMLEAERWRLERRIAELAGLLGDGPARGKTQEISELAHKLTETDEQIVRLRTTLNTLRERTDEVRAAAA